MQLKTYLDSLTEDTAFWATGLYNPEYPVNEFGKLTEDVASKLQSLAIAILLVEGDSELFHHNLIRSGNCHLKFIERCKEEKFSDFHLAVSRFRGFFSILATNDFDNAIKIAELSPNEWNSSGEYEDDYCFAKFFHLLVLGRLGSESSAALLKQFGESLQGDSDPRLDLCQAMDQKNQECFNTAFASYLESKDGKIEDDHAEHTPSIIANNQISVEGLAILRAAEHIGLKTEPEYKYCPAMARVPMTVPFPGE